MTLSLQDEIRLLPKLSSDELTDTDVVLVVSQWGAPKAMTIPELVKGAIRIANEKKAKK